MLVCITFTMNAQTSIDTSSKKNNARAKVETVKGQTALVLKAGRNTTIDLKIESNTWRQIDSIVAGPWGSAIKMKDIDGQNVDVAKVNVNSRVGLMFTSGAKCVVITKEDYETLK